MAGSPIIELVARLDTDESAKHIKENDLKTIEDNLKNNSIKIKCSLDTDSINSIKSEVGKIVKSIKLDVGINAKTDKKVINKEVDSIKKTLQLSVAKIGSQTDFSNAFKPLLQEFRNAYLALDTNGIEKSFNDIIGFIKETARESIVLDDAFKKVKDSIQDAITAEGRIGIDSRTYGDLLYMYDNEQNTENVLNTVFGKKKWELLNSSNRFSFPGFDTIVEHLNSNYGTNIESLAEGIQQLYETISRPVPKGTILELLPDSQALFDELARGLKLPSDVFEVWNTGEVWAKVDADELIQNFKQVNQEFSSFEKNVASDISIDNFFDESIEQSDELHRKQVILQQDYNKLKATIDKTHQSIKLFSQVDNQDQDAVFNQLMKNPIGDYETLQKARDAYTMIRKEFELTSASMASDIPSNVLESLIQRIAKVDSQIRILKVDYENLDFVPESLKKTFADLSELSAKFDFSPDFQVESREELTERVKRYTEIKVLLNDAQSQIRAEQKEEAAFNKEFEKELKIEERINKEKQKAFDKEFAKALKEEEKELALKQKQLEVIKQIKNEEAETYEQSRSDYWQGNFDEQSQKGYWDSRRQNTIKSMTEENQVLKDMKKYYEELEKSQQEFYKSSSKAVTLSNRIKKLSADMENFAVANERAVSSTRKMSDGTTFQQKWIQLNSQMAKGSELTADEVKHLREEFVIFGKEASAAGLKGASSFDKFKKSFTVFSSYLSANMVFNFVKQQIRQMAQEVINVDTAMTELRKVTEATDAEFEAFALSAAKTGKQLGASISEVINATAEFARAGFNLPDAEELGKIATLYKNVGDGIDINQASESIISIVKAFNIEAKNSIEIIDRINEVSNRAAIDSGGLGFALQRVASAMVSANNTLDETIALTTSANEIVQNPEMVA